MAELRKRYAQALMNLAQEHGSLEEIYQQALMLNEDNIFTINENLPEELKSFWN